MSQNWTELRLPLPAPLLDQLDQQAQRLGLTTEHVIAAKLGYWNRDDDDAFVISTLSHLFSRSAYSNQAGEVTTGLADESPEPPAGNVIATTTFDTKESA